MLDKMGLNDVLGLVKHYLPVVIGVVLVAVVLRLLAGVLRRSLNRMVSNGTLRSHSADRLSSAFRWFGIAVIVLLLLQATGVVEQTWAVLSAAITALAVAFVAMWSILSNVTCALLLLIFKPFKTGDTVTLVDADKVLAGGVIADLNLIFTTMRSDDGTLHRIPNNLFLQKVFRVSRQGALLDPSEDHSSSFFGTG